MKLKGRVRLGDNVQEAGPSQQEPQQNAEMEAPVAHACNPSYSGGKDQKYHSSKSAQANSL
jgi:hypothetical protein